MWFGRHAWQRGTASGRYSGDTRQCGCGLTCCGVTKQHLPWQSISVHALRLFAMHGVCWSVFSLASSSNHLSSLLDRHWKGSTLEQAKVAFCQRAACLLSGAEDRRQPGHVVHVLLQVAFVVFMGLKTRQIVDNVLCTHSQQTTT